MQYCVHPCRGAALAIKCTCQVAVIRIFSIPSEHRRESTENAVCFGDFHFLAAKKSASNWRKPPKSSVLACPHAAPSNTALAQRLDLFQRKRVRQSSRWRRDVSDQWVFQRCVMLCVLYSAYLVKPELGFSCENSWRHGNGKSGHGISVRKPENRVSWAQKAGPQTLCQQEKSGKRPKSV